MAHPELVSTHTAMSALQDWASRDLDRGTSWGLGHYCGQLVKGQIEITPGTPSPFPE